MKKTGKGNNKDMEQKNSFKVSTNLSQLKKQTKGITLIALVITIIVLLILAAVTIATLTGDNGILTRASDASERTREANAREQVQLAVQGSYDETGKINIDDLNTELSRIDDLTSGTPISSLPATVVVDGYEITINADGSVTIGNNSGGGTETGETVVDGVTIPEGFYYVDGTTVDTGLVISDQPNDDLNNSAGGNQFVWVPVDDYSEFVRRAGYFNGSEQTLTSDYGEADSTGNNTNSGVTETATTQAEAQAMYASVEEHGGFYIGRYEAGRDTNGNVVVKKGVDVYDNIPWSANGMYETEGTTGGAVELARNFDSANGYTSVTSTLIYGVQWDAVMKWMEDIENPNVSGRTYIQDSTGMGWYSDNSGYTVHQTGIDVDSNKSNCVNNIYDLAGNVWEWTMESYDTNYRVSRGGDSYYAGSKYPASFRFGDSPSYSDDDVGFRLTLYL